MSPDVASSLLDPIVLARIQFAANITFHILFPTISIAMGWILLFFKLRFNATGDQKWQEAYGFWVKIFALTFALGVVSGITMSFQFGTNWPGYMQTVGNIAGPLLAYEVLTAFFLEATFLGIMLFGQKKVSNRVHTFATLLVAGGTTLSAFWIIVLNSWMQTPTGFEMINGQAHVTSWLEVIFNPSMPYRLTHMLLASGLTAAFLVAGISAYRWFIGQRTNAVLAAMKTGVALAAILIPLQILVGDMHGLNTFKHQPAKIAAIEGIWETERGAPLLLFALPNAETRSNDFAIGIPKVTSLILTHELNGEIRGLNEFAEHPPVAKVFWSFRVMVGVGMLMLLTSWLAAWQLRRTNTLSPLVNKVLIGMTFSGWVATVAGWYVTEIGRQPWLVQGVLLTKDAASHVGSGMILSTLLMYLALYVFLLISYVSVVFYLAKKAGQPAGEH
ncbi:cytochrome ubiquinol oxidase subunit I [Deefgea tanakiae]|uniref:Cytochrome ubiquinol oxidase subunit I n=1 Tax=Deefgea tanakiae TaxID=2865840 RepID=A0ABX8Z824_9NEIS|nr:cytochrome ubiquinol oxidase subunit I [Deefgea tanakiae]QZA78723.1 cytochrome ubiquinol oxidase subunit I [Deefgea tanakiae]